MRETPVSDDEQAVGTRAGQPAAATRTPSAETALLFVPVLILAWMGWQHRWMCDDAFINFRIVKQILAGHGPVFNTGDRVEAGTSPLWLAILTVFDVITPLRIEWIAVYASIAATVGGLMLAIFGTRRALLAIGVTGTFLPLGALVYAVLPPAWDFATSGLEVGLSVLWLGWSWWLLTGRLAAPGPAGRVPWKPWWVPVVLGLGPLVRPDFLIFSAFFVLALVLVDADAGWKRHLTTIGIAAALPIVTEVLRMAYYGNIVPNTAIAKEGSLSNWPEGWFYLRDFVDPHLLLVPLIVLAGVFLVPIARRAHADAHRAWFVFGLTIAGGLTHGLYVVRVGGDYMHGRMLLPALFVLLLPFSVVAARSWQWVAIAVVVAWATASASVLRTPYSTALPLLPASVNAAFDSRHVITDERLVQMRLSTKEHPVTLADYSEYDEWADAGFATKSILRAGGRGLILDPGTDSVDPRALIPLNGDVHAPIVAFVGAVGVYAYAAGDSVKVVDLFGIVDWLSAHQLLDGRKRPGHEKAIPTAWMFARFADSGAPIPSTITAQDVAAAREALRCGEFPELIRSTEGSLGLGRIFDNIEHALSLSRFRFSGDPQTAQRELCGL